MRLILDTSELIQNWRHWRGRERGALSRHSVKNWARELASLHDTNEIVTPVYIEFIGGARSKAELDLFHAYLTEFRIIDDGRVLPVDWSHTERLARRISAGGKSRDLGDCLIAALAVRYRGVVQTQDLHFPK
jgi:predicted nucleic acid-binding protein